jgi:hypothetical protein
VTENGDIVVEGKVLRSGEQVRITGQSIQATADRHLWAKIYEGQSAGLPWQCRRGWLTTLRSRSGLS